MRASVEKRVIVVRVRNRLLTIGLAAGVGASIEDDDDESSAKQKAARNRNKARMISFFKVSSSGTIDWVVRAVLIKEPFASRSHCG